MVKTVEDNSEMMKQSIKRISKIAKIPSTDLVTQDPQRKLVGTQEMALPFLDIMSRRHAEQIADSRAIYDILPDLAIAEQTLVDNILSPTDLKRGDLSVGLHAQAPAECAVAICEHFSSDAGYNLNKLLPEFIKEGLITIGSVPLLPLPPSAIRNVITNNTYGLESLDDNTYLKTVPTVNLRLPIIGHIGQPNTTVKGNSFGALSSIALESAIDDTITAANNGRDKNNEKVTQCVIDALNELKTEVTNSKSDLLVEITDNPTYLVHGQLQESVNDYNSKTLTSIGWGFEDINDKNSPMKQYRDRTVKLMPFLEMLFNKDANDTQNPLVMRLPAESVIPIISPTTQKHLAYYILIDSLTGNPLRLRSNLNKYKVLADKLDKTVADQATTVNYSFGVSYPGTNSITNTQRSNSTILLSAYEERFERELREVIKNGRNGMEVDIVKVPDVYKMMFARQLTKQQTRVIYVPADRLAYLAYNYTEDGIGESLIEKTKLQSSFRAILKFAQTMAAVKSSINRSKLSINIDDNDPDPRGTVDIVRNETAGNMSSGFPIYKFQTADIVDSLQKAGIQTEINGSKFPTTKVDLVENKREVSAPDTGLQDLLKEEHYQGWGLSLDLLEKANQIDFMGQIDNINLLQSKRMCGRQTITCEISADFMKKYLRCGGKLYLELKEILEVNKSELTMEELIESLTVILPKADYAQHDAQLKAFDQYSNFIDKALDAVLSDSEMGGDIAGVKTIFSNELKRRYLRSRNILPEMFEMLADNDNTLRGILNEHIKTNVQLVEDLAVYIVKAENKVDKKIQSVNDKLNPPEPEEPEQIDDAGGDADNTDDLSTNDLEAGDTEEDDTDTDDIVDDEGTDDSDNDSDTGDEESVDDVVSEDDEKDSEGEDDTETKSGDDDSNDDDSTDKEDDNVDDGEEDKTEDKE
jgi:hypothetical protein